MLPHTTNISMVFINRFSLCPRLLPREFQFFTNPAGTMIFSGYKWAWGENRGVLVDMIKCSNLCILIISVALENQLSATYAACIIRWHHFDSLGIFIFFRFCLYFVCVVGTSFYNFSFSFMIWVFSISFWNKNFFLFDYLN